MNSIRRIFNEAVKLQPLSVYDGLFCGVLVGTGLAVGSIMVAGGAPLLLAFVAAATPVAGSVYYVRMASALHEGEWVLPNTAVSSTEANTQIIRTSAMVGASSIIARR